MAKEEREEDRPLTPMSAMSMNWPTPVDFWNSGNFHRRANGAANVADGSN